MSFESVLSKVQINSIELQTLTVAQEVIPAIREVRTTIHSPLLVYLFGHLWFAEWKIRPSDIKALEDKFRSFLFHNRCEFYEIKCLTSLIFADVYGNFSVQEVNWKLNDEICNMLSHFQPIATLDGTYLNDNLVDYLRNECFKDIRNFIDWKF